MKKRLALIFCIVSCVLMMAGCSLVKENKNFNKSDLEKQTDQFIESWFAADFEGTISQYKDQMDDTTLEQYKTYAKDKKRYQGVDKKIKTDFTISTDSATVSETLLCKNGEKVIVSLSFSEDGNIQTDDNGTYVFKFDEYKTLGQKMQKAGINTILSMGIVFIVLICIALLISCFVLIGKAQNKQTAPVAKAEPVAAASAVPAEEENLVDDLELVAVITAAIAAASETESADGLVVRSIIRR